MAPIPWQNWAQTTTLMVNGINCGGCSGPLSKALDAIDDLEVVSIATKAETGSHPNAVVVKHACTLERIRGVIAKLDGKEGLETSAEY